MPFDAPWWSWLIIAALITLWFWAAVYKPAQERRAAERWEIDRRREETVAATQIKEPWERDAYWSKVWLNRALRARQEGLWRLHDSCMLTSLAYAEQARIRKERGPIT